MPSWPETLPPRPLAEGYKETLPDTVLRTQMESGPAKLRARTSAGVAGIDCAYHLSAAQADALAEFYKETLTYGSLAFDFTHPRTGASVSCRFKRPPALASRNGLHFRADVSLEVLP